MDNFKMVILGGFMMVATAVILVALVLGGDSSGVVWLMFWMHLIGGWGFGIAGLLGSENVKRYWQQIDSQQQHEEKGS